MKEWKRLKATLPTWDFIFIHIVRFPWPFFGVHLNSWEGGYVGQTTRFPGNWYNDMARARLQATSTRIPADQPMRPLHHQPETTYHGGLLWLVHFNSAIVSMYHGFLRRSLVFRASLVSMFFYCRHPRYRYFGSVVPVYVVWAESCVNCLFHFPCVPMAFSVNKLITLDKWFEITFLPIVDNWVKWKYFLGIIIKRIKFKFLDQSYFFSALRSGIFRT